MPAELNDIRDRTNSTKSWQAPVLSIVGLLFFVQSVVIAVIIVLQKYPTQSLESLTGSLFGCCVFLLWAWYSSGADDRRSRLKTVLITLGTAYVFLGLGPKTIEFLHDRQVEELARQWFARAQGDAMPTWTENDAIRWLRGHDIQPYRSVGANAVVGYRQIDEGGRIFKPSTVRMTFVFDGNDKFKRVEYEFLPFSLPGGSKSNGKSAQ